MEIPDELLEGLPDSGLRTIVVDNPKTAQELVDAAEKGGIYDFICVSNAGLKEGLVRLTFKRKDVNHDIKRGSLAT